MNRDSVYQVSSKFEHQMLFHHINLATLRVDIPLDVWAKQLYWDKRKSNMYIHT